MLSSKFSVPSFNTRTDQDRLYQLCIHFLNLFPVYCDNFIPCVGSDGFCFFPAYVFCR